MTRVAFAFQPPLPLPLPSFSLLGALCNASSKSQTYLAEDAKKSDPQDKQNGIPGGDKDATGLDDEGYEVESARSRRQSADHDGVDL